jgi:hypothetical protein
VVRAKRLRRMKIKGDGAQVLDSHEEIQQLEVRYPMNVTRINPFRTYHRGLRQRWRDDSAIAPRRGGRSERIGDLSHFPVRADMDDVHGGPVRF